jgi:hypothetical protein
MTMKDPDLKIERDGETREIYRLAMLVPLPDKVRRGGPPVTPDVVSRLKLLVPLPGIDLTKPRDAERITYPRSEENACTGTYLGDPNTAAGKLKPLLLTGMTTTIKPGRIVIRGEVTSGAKVTYTFEPRGYDEKGRLVNDCEVRLIEP